MQIVVLPQVIEQRLKVEERKEVIDFINELITDTSDALKNDIIVILEERFEKKLFAGLVTLKLELMEKISSSTAQLNERISKTESMLNERISKTESMLNDKISKTESMLNERISTMKIDLVEKIANSKTETIKWMFIFWISNVITIIGGLIGILKIAKVF